MNHIILSWQPYELALKYPFTISGYSRTHTPIVLVQIKLDGWVGYGEAALPQYLGESQNSVINFLKKVDLTQFSFPLCLEDVLAYVDSVALGNTAAKASIDIALHDLIGKIQGKSWVDIWNLNRRNTPYTTYTIGIDTDEIIKKKVSEVSSKFKYLKIKLGSNNDKQLIRSIRSITNLPLLVDANQGWSNKEEALETIFWLNDEGVFLVEQPMDKSDLDSHAWLTEKSPIPIFADESVQRLSDLNRIKGAFSGVNVKLMKCTGMHEAKKMLDIAPKLGFDVMLGCMTESSCAISAASQLSPMVNYADLDGALLITNDCFRGTAIVNGKIVVNTLPGIGVEPIF